MRRIPRQLSLLALLLASVVSSKARAQLRVLPDPEPQCVFAGEGRTISVRVHNPGNRRVDSDLSARYYQTTSATAVAVAEAPWKRLQVLPGQVILESAALSFPAVKAETRFLVQWLEGTNTVIGTTEVLVYPPDLLKDLKPLLGEEPLGVFDPLNELKPLLKAVRVEVEDLEESGLGSYRGKLAIIGPFTTNAQMRESLANRSVKALAARGTAVVWIQPPPAERAGLKPSFYAVPEGKGAVVVVQAELVADLAESPQAQLNLVRLARLALHPEPLQLPDLTTSQ